MFCCDPFKTTLHHFPQTFVNTLLRILYKFFFSLKKLKMKRPVLICYIQQDVETVMLTTNLWSTWPKIIGQNDRREPYDVSGRIYIGAILFPKHTSIMSLMWYMSYDRNDRFLYYLPRKCGEVRQMSLVIQCWIRMNSFY